MRWDEQGWDAYGPSSLQDIRAGIDAKGKITAFETNRWSFPGAGLAKLRETTEEQLGMTLTNAQIQGAIANASIETTYYTIANQRAISKAIPYNLGGYLKQAPIRENATAVFGIETMMDELAYAAGMDPIEFRLQNMTQAANGRDMDPLVAIKQVANWDEPPVGVEARERERRPRPRRRGDRQDRRRRRRDRGQQEDRQDHRRRTCIGVQDVGLAISPGLVQNQMTGSLVQTVSRALLEGMTLQQEPRDGARLRDVPDPAVQGRAEGDDGRAAAHRPDLVRRGRAARARDATGARQRVLRRDRRADPPATR